jgi:FkbM family methyltransferase
VLAFGADNMIISTERLSRTFGVKPKGVLHVGAHEAEELEQYQTLGWGPTIWVEMLPEKAAALKRRFAGDPHNSVLHAACWDVDGVSLPIFRANSGGSSSLLKPDRHLAAYPEVLFAQDTAILTSRLDSILPASATIEFINLDIQGAELRALMGLGLWLKKAKWVYSEVSVSPLYTDSALLVDIDAFLAAAGFFRVLTSLSPAKGHGEAFYANANLMSKSEIQSIKKKAAIWRSAQFISQVPKYLRPRSIMRRVNAWRSMSS